MSYHQPGPYGQQPPQPGQPGPGGYGGGQQPPQGPPPTGPNPYAQGGAAPGGPGYGYPPQYPGQPGQPQPQPQQPGAPYGAPQQPGPYQQQPPAPTAYPGQQQPYPGQQQPYNQMPGPSGGSGKKVGVIIGAIVALAAVGGGLYFVLSGGNEQIAADDGTRYDLVLPEKSGAFILSEKGSGDEAFSSEELGKAGLADMEQVSGEYYTFDIDSVELGLYPEGSRVLGVSGLYGEVENPQQTVELLFAETAKSIGEEDELELIGSAESFTDKDVAMKCQQAQGTELDESVGYKITATVCLWADYSTVGATYVAPLPNIPSDFDPTSDEVPNFKEPEPIGKSLAADIAKQLRNDSLQERTSS
ncbi:hypothetical protein [Streptomyces aidingensis]|uniref:Uncharacterized protein n=1 Tax=Streptomyces aidingensis TaxID=910347 RepID=A0A1I1FHF7_9ACTN|nr:hypothetical protein [Streptomyces aidingensis]SFB98837.1 hypothetical protein SAMN05421773_101740 [Streptomyces aidingensis]